jgi:hypothetical protein
MNAFYIGALPTVLGNKRTIKRDFMVELHLYLGYIRYITQSNMETVLAGFLSILNTLKLLDGKMVGEFLLKGISGYIWKWSRD